MVMSLAMALEYDTTCQRAEHCIAAGMSRAEARIFVDGVTAMAEAVEIHFRWRPVLRDPGDEMILEAAVNRQADAIVSFNRRDFSAAERFGLEVLLPGEALGRIGK